MSSSLRGTPTDAYLEPELAMEPRAAEFHLADYLQILRRRWLLIAVIVILFGAGGLIHFLVTPKMYRATSTIQIDRRTLSIGAVESPWLENWWNMEFYPTQYKLLESRGLAERVVLQERLYEDPDFNPAWARWGAASAEAAGGSPDLDEAQLGSMGQRLLGGLEVSPVKNTQLVSISYRTSSPVLAARVANGVADAFIDWGIETRSETVGKTSSFLGKQVDALKQEIQDKEQMLQAYSRRSDIVALEPESNPTLQRLEKLNSDWLGAVSQRIDVEAKYNELMSVPAESAAGDALASGLVADLRQKLMTKEQEYATKARVYKPDLPSMVTLREEIEDLRGRVQELAAERASKVRSAAFADLQTARRREEALRQELDRAKEEVIDFGSAAVEYNNLKMEISTRRQLLDELLQRQSETEVAARLQATRESNVRVVDRALLPGGAYSPSLRRDLTMALGLGLFLAVGCVFLLEYLDRTIKSGEEAERILGLPVLAVIPDIEEKGGRYGYGYGYGAFYGVRRRQGEGKRPLLRQRKDKGDDRARNIELLPQERPRHAISEAYRSLRTALLLSTADELKVVGLTSAQSGEGKTATVANLAVVMAQLGKRVLLIDADLRKPRQHRVFRVSNRLGLVHALTAGSSLGEVAQATEVQGLEVVVAGAIPPNPSELLASDRMRELLADASRRYDLILVDTPPLLAVTDAALVGVMADGIVFCLQAGRVLRDEAVASCDRLRLAGVKVLGTVLNRYLPSKGGDSKHYYYHYQAYGEPEGSQSADSAA